MADLSFLDPTMNSTDETPMGAVSPDLSFLDPDQGVRLADPSALINARELTHGMDPQRTAKVIDLSRKAGLPPRIVEERMDEIERREMLNDGLLADVASKAPKTTSFLSDPDRFAVAQADIENLAEIERILATGPIDEFASSGRVAATEENKLAKELIADPLVAISKGLIKAPGSLAEMGLNIFSILPGAIDSAAQGAEQLTGLPRGGYFGELRDAALGASKWIRENYLEAEPLQISKDLRGKGAWDNPEIMLDPEWVAYVTTDILPSIGATIAAYLAGGPAAAGIVGGGMEAGGLYQELLDEGMEDWKANTASQVYGVLSGALNAFGADKVLGKGVATSWAKRLVKGFFVKGATEGATEWAEEPIQALVAGIARGDSVPTIAADIVEATQKGFDVFLPSLITGGLAGTATERMEYQKAQFAAKEQEVLDMLTENVAQSNLAQLDPVLYQEALTVLKEGGKISDIHIPASAIMSDNLAEVSEVLNQLGVSFETFDLALNSGDTVAIPVEKYGAAIAANPDLAVRFANDRKLSADGYTRNELAQFNQEWALEAKRVLRLAAETEELKDQEDAETKAIYEQVYAARQAAGRVPDAARLDAAQFTAALVSMAKMSEGKYTPTQLFEAYMPQIRQGGQPAVDQQALQQQRERDIKMGVAWSDERLDREIRISAYPDGQSKAMVAWVSPASFVAANTQNDRQATQIKDEAGDLRLEDLRENDQTPFLYVEEGPDGKLRIAGHEGRHRLSALAKAGVSRVPVVLDFRQPKRRERMESLTLEPEFGSRALPVIAFDAIPLTRENAGVVRKAMIDNTVAGRMIAGGQGYWLSPDDVTRFQTDVAYAGVENEAEIQEAGRLWAEMGTESPYFKRWSGGAPVVLKNAAPSFVTGQAVVVEADHGSPDIRFVQEDGIFKSEKERYGFGRSEAAFWFSRDTATAKTYADPRRAFDYQNAEPGIVSAFVRLDNPLVVDAAGQNWRDAQKRGKTSDVIREARESGHDGVIIYNVKDDYNNDKKTRSTTTLTVFSSNQIKSTGNRGTFDPADARIQYQAGPPIDPFDTAGDWATQELELEEGTATAGEVVQALKARAAELQKLVECLK